MTAKKVAAASITTALVLSTSGVARADYDFQLALGVHGGWMRKSPALGAQPVSTSARELDGGKVATRRSLALLGPYADASLTLDDRWTIPLLGGAVYWPLGSYDETVTSLDGSIASVRPWTTVRADVLFPGIGRRFKHRRMMWAATLRTGMSFIKMDGSIAAGADVVPLDLSASTFLLQAELEACRRLDPTTRVCLMVAPRIYEHELLNGLVFGLRAEWGR